jgi:opacity protein-like surface antigen
MKRFLCVIGMLAAVGLLMPASVAASPVAVANGGGNGTFDGVNSGSHFGFGVVFGSRIRGHFECNMAGNAAFGDLHLMAVEGSVTSGTVDVASGTATFRGTATLHVDNEKSTIGYEVEIHEGGPQVGWLHLTVFNSPFGPVFTFPLEHVLTGQISVH